VDADVLKRVEAIVSNLRSDPRSVPSEDVALALDVLPAYYLRTRYSVYMRCVRGAPDWLEHESLAWELSEPARSWLKAKRTPAERSCVLDAIARIVRDPRQAKGRQNFVLLLGEFGGAGYGETLGSLLGDPSVAGHAVKALIKSRTPGYAAQVRELLSEAKTAWVKTAARKYLSLIKE